MSNEKSSEYYFTYSNDCYITPHKGWLQVRLCDATGGVFITEKNLGCSEHHPIAKEEWMCFSQASALFEALRGVMKEKGRSVWVNKDRWAVLLCKDCGHKTIRLHSVGLGVWNCGRCDSCQTEIVSEDFK